MQQEIKEKTPLLNENGQLNTCGYAKKMNFIYNRDYTKGFPFKLKEWDFYQFQQDHYVLQLTIGHVSYMAQASVNLLDLDTGKKLSIGTMQPLTTPKLSHDPEEPSFSEYISKDFHMSFKVSNEKRILSFLGKDKTNGDVAVELIIENDVNNEKMVIATPFEKPTQFYLNYKENYYEVNGFVRFGETEVLFEHATGLLDWGRGIWPYSHEWYWGSLTSHIDGVPLGFNIGWGFGNTQNATEDMYFYNKKAYKIEKLEAHWNHDDLMKPIYLTDEDGTFQCTFTPIFNNHTENKYIVVDTECDQLFGYFTGSIQTEDGRKEFKDVLAFIEHATNHW